MALSIGQLTALKIVGMIQRHGKPGPGGVDITSGIPSEIYIGIGREHYAEPMGDYELARDTANSVRTDLISWICREFDIPKPVDEPEGASK